MPRAWLAGGLAALVIVALGVEVARARSARARHHFTRYTGALLREHEHHAWSGATWLLAAYLLAVLLYPRPFAIAAMWAVGVGDATAAVVGRWWGERRRARAVASGAAAGAVGAKTYAGTATCFVAALGGARLVAGLPLAAACAVAAAAALAERPRRPLDDNLRIVLAVGLIALVWHAVAG